MTCQPDGTDSDGVKAICVARAARQAGRSVRGSHAAVRCAKFVFGTHDMQSHANERSKNLTHDQIVLIHDAVVIALNQSATKLRRNLCQTQGSPESYKHIAPSMIRSIRRRVKTARDQLTMQQLDTTAVPESLGELIEWCKANDIYRH